MTKESKQYVPLFYQRFNIEVNQLEAQGRFVNRVINFIEGTITGLSVAYRNPPGPIRLALIAVSSRLGKECNYQTTFRNYAKADFQSCLLAVEALYDAYNSTTGHRKLAKNVDMSIREAISLSETDLGIEWRDGVFWRSGAKQLDEALINENLKWLADRHFQDVLVPFEKGLRDFLEAKQKPEKLKDTVTDIYEAVEALAKRITDRDRDLSANAELFISRLKLSGYYKQMLKNYIEYAGNYRHAAKLGKEKKPLSENEVEAFIYTSGLFIRLAVQQIG